MKLFLLAATLLVASPAIAGYRVCPITGRTYNTTTREYVSDDFVPPTETRQRDDSWERTYLGYNEYLGY